MRKLCLKDAFSVARIIKAADVRSEIIRFAGELHSGKSVDEIGLEFFVTLIQSAADETVEEKIYKLYADLKGVTPDDVAFLEFAEVKNDIKEIVESNDLKSFFQSVSALMSKQ
jgi:hypothetical protein